MKAQTYLCLAEQRTQFRILCIQQCPDEIDDPALFVAERRAETGSVKQDTADALARACSEGAQCSDEG